MDVSVEFTCGECVIDYDTCIQQVTDRMEELKRQYDEKSAQKEELRKKAEITELKLERAGKLVSGLAGERDRWEASVKVRKLEHHIAFF